jgi:light-harvesting complex I chlorophyll a/b binding protein 1
MSTNEGDFDDDDDDEDTFLLEQLARIEAMEETPDAFGESNMVDDDDDDDNFADLFADDDFPEAEDLKELEKQQVVPAKSAKGLEEALMSGVVPAGAGVGSNCLPGDWDFDPWKLATKDYIGKAQRAVTSLIPGSSSMTGASATTEDRPSALILRDYREAEIRHGRLAMLASLFWPLQEMFDRLLLDESQFGSLVYSSGVTLPYIPLLMTAIMLLLGYLDVYSQSIKDFDEIGEAFLPGDCFWDPLSILQGAPDLMKRNMQERELFNGRMAMLAIALYFWEELTTHQPLISIEGNELLFQPAYEIPFVQSWLDSQFAPFEPIVGGTLPIDL